MTQYCEQAKCDEVKVESLPAQAQRLKTLTWHLGCTIDSDDESSKDELMQLDSVKSALNSYDTLYIQKKADILQFWEGEEAIFPTLYCMAMDYLPIQGSAVLSLMKALQMLKFHQKQTHLDFTMGLLLPLHRLLFTSDVHHNHVMEIQTNTFTDTLDPVLLHKMCFLLLLKGLQSSTFNPSMSKATVDMDIDSNGAEVEGYKSPLPDATPVPRVSVQPRETSPPPVHTFPAETLAIQLSSL
ncbi:hypothetical protein BDN67DRAFT_1015704 [Paxillus ammoniavirescens]|nr:hypothetical protein BDN67DRAFT_1015704 [Paxillus ammoniavirescens]